MVYRCIIFSVAPVRPSGVTAPEPGRRTHPPASGGYNSKCTIPAFIGDVKYFLGVPSV